MRKHRKKSIEYNAKQTNEKLNRQPRKNETDGQKYDLSH